MSQPPLVVSPRTSSVTVTPTNSTTQAQVNTRSFNIAISRWSSRRSTSVMTSFWLSTTGVSPCLTGQPSSRSSRRNCVHGSDRSTSSWDEWPELAADLPSVPVRCRRGDGYRKELFVEAVLPAQSLETLNRRKWMNTANRSEPQHRRPTLTWPRQIPIEGEPAEVVEIVESYADWLSGASLPKLFVNADPGAILTGAQRDFVRSWPNLSEVTVHGNTSCKRTAQMKSAKPSMTG